MINAVENAVQPLKADAVESAERYAKATIARVHAALEACGWDLDKAAPGGNGRMTRPEYMMAQGKRNLYTKITHWTEATRSSFSEPLIVRKDEECEARFIAEARAEAAAQYDAFVAKLTMKIGACETATLEGSHVWSESRLMVKKAEVTEIWKTKQIWNVSVLGKHFPQWPSRKVKA